jgi:uncharacterized protein YdaT
MAPLRLCAAVPCPFRISRSPAAIEIANALLEEGMDEGKAIRIAIAKVKEWGRSHLAES